MSRGLAVSFTSRMSHGALLALLTSLAMPAAMAQDAPGDSGALQEIMVTARKRAESLQDVPMTISAITREELNRQGIRNLRDVAKLTPGLTVEDGSWPNASRISMRGLQTDVGRSAVAMLVDDIDVSTESLYTKGTGFLMNLRLFDMERVEVVKGPQSALYGRAAFGGAVNYISRRPNLEAWDASVDIEASNEAKYEGRASLSGPLSENRLAIGLNAAVWDGEGFYNNSVTGKRIGGQEGTGVAGAFLFQPSPQFSAYGRVEYSDEQLAQRPAVMLAANTTVNFTPDVQRVTGRASGATFSGNIDELPEDVQLATDSVTNAEFKGVSLETLVSTLVLEGSVGEVGIKSLSGWVDQEASVNQDNDFRLQPSVSGSQVPANFTTQEWDAVTDTKIFSQELRISSQSESRLQWMVGGLYWIENIDQDQSQTTVVPRVPLAVSFVRQLLSSNRSPRSRQYSRDTDHWSLFGWTEYSFNDRWSTSVEARYSRDKLDYTTFGNVVFLNVTGTTQNPIVTNIRPTPPSQPPVSITDSFTTPRLSVRYRPTENTTFYASAAKGVKPAGYSTRNVAVFTERERFGEEVLWSYEIGVKQQWPENGLQLNAAAYLQDYTKQQVAFRAVDAVGVPSEFTRNAADSTRWGVDIDASWQLGSRLSLAGSYAYVNASFDQYEVLSNDAGRIAEIGCSRVVESGAGLAPNCLLVYTGNSPGLQPEHQLSLSATWDAPLTDSLNYLVEANARYVGKRYVDVPNNASMSAYWRADLRAGVHADRFEVLAYAENLFDDRTPTSALNWFDYQTATFQPNILAFLPTPRTLGIRTSFRF